MNIKMKSVLALNWVGNLKTKQGNPCDAVKNFVLFLFKKRKEKKSTTKMQKAKMGSGRNC